MKKEKELPKQQVVLTEKEVREYLNLQKAVWDYLARRLGYASWQDIEMAHRYLSVNPMTRVTSVHYRA